MAKRFLVLLCSVLSISCLLSAQAPPKADDSLVISAGDGIQVHVFDTPEFDQAGRVNDSGQFELAMGGEIKLAGMTQADAGKAIERFYVAKQLLLHPRVLVKIDSSVTQDVTVMGEVHSPGKIPIPTPLSILDVLARAGGITTAADRHVLVQRHGTSDRVSFFMPNDPSQAMNDAITIYPGDMIIVPKAGIVYAIGSFKISGGFTMTNNDGKITVLQLIARAGGIDGTGKASAARLIRKTATGYVEAPLNLSKIEKGERSDFALQADDIVYIPYSYVKLFAANSTSVASSVGTASIYRF